MLIYGPSVLYISLRLSTWVEQACLKRRPSEGMDSFTVAQSNPPHPVMAVAIAFLQVNMFLCSLALHAELAPQLVH